MTAIAGLLIMLAAGATADVAPARTDPAIYAAALARAERYEDDAQANLYRDKAFYPPLSDTMSQIRRACLKPDSPPPPRFTLIVGFQDGRPVRTVSDSDLPVAACVADILDAFPWPDPPYPDFAEEIHFDLPPPPADGDKP